MVAVSRKGVPRPDNAAHVRNRTQNPPLAVSELDMATAALEYMRAEKKGKRSFPSDADVVQYIRKTYGCETSKAVAVLRYAHRQVAEVIQAITPTLAQTTIADLREIQAEARRAGDLGTAGRIGIAIGRFMGLDGPQVNPESQARQLSDAALEAAMRATVMHTLESMPDDQLDDLLKRRGERRLQGARQVALGPPTMIDAEAQERNGTDA